jgi:octaprenyl-diphosphate synthase
MQLPSHPCPDDLKHAFNLIGPELTHVQQRILSFVSEDLSIAIQDTIEPLRNTLFSGKMIRPALVLLAGKACGGIVDEHIRVAALVEIIHNATLLHDDVIDEGCKRRGVATINSLWGNESAVLLGDFLLSKVFQACADLDPAVIRIIAAAVARTCEGELRQVSRRGNWQLTESEYIDIITEKTAALFSCCCELGVLLAGANKAQQQSLACFGLNVGIAFQITDDLLDIVGDEVQTGKTLGSDVDKNKLTLAVIHLLNTLERSQKKEMAVKLNVMSEDKKAVAGILSSFGALEYAEARGQEFANKAIKSLAELKQSDAKSALIEVAKFVGCRAQVHCL